MLSGLLPREVDFASALYLGKEVANELRRTLIPPHVLQYLTLLIHASHNAFFSASTHIIADPISCSRYRTSNKCTWRDAVDEIQPLTGGVVMETQVDKDCLRDTRSGTPAERSQPLAGHDARQVWSHYPQQAWLMRGGCPCAINLLLLWISQAGGARHWFVDSALAACEGPGSSRAKDSTLRGAINLFCSLSYLRRMPYIVLLTVEEPHSISISPNTTTNEDAVIVTQQTTRSYCGVSPRLSHRTVYL